MLSFGMMSSAALCIADADKMYERLVEYESANEGSIEISEISEISEEDKDSPEMK
jgi:hypothetical protein